eukprot:jgi/Botrbrau1/14085/Bobra.182_3s0032.2
MNSGASRRGQATAYQVLGVARDASQEEVRAAYRRAVLAAHPDKGSSANPIASGEASSTFNAIQSAWEAVKDAEHRVQYDQSLAACEVGQSEVAIWQDVDLAEFTPCDAGEGAGFLFSYPCRCGGSYLFAEADLAVDASSAAVPCDTCSLAVRVLYTVA